MALYAVISKNGDTFGDGINSFLILSLIVILIYLVQDIRDFPGCISIPIVFCSLIENPNNI